MSEVAPKIIADMGYKVAENKWAPKLNESEIINEKNKVYTVYTAQYEKLEDVIPVEPNTQKPDGYVTVTLDPTEKGTLNGQGSFYVKPNVEVTIPAQNPIAKVGFKFIELDKNLKGIFQEDTTITAKYEVVTDDNGNGNNNGNGNGKLTSKLPKTNIGTMLFAQIALVSGAMAVVLNKKRR